MNNNFAKDLLKNPNIKTELKIMIIDKANRYEDLIKSGKLLSEKEEQEIFEKEITPTNIQRLINNYETREELKIIVRDLSSMCFELNKSDNKIKSNSDWEIKYEYATKGVRIESVFSHFLHTEDLKRNINCPFHEDTNASLKVYTKDNRFVCFGCGIKGSSIDFVMQYMDCTFNEAVNYLNNL